jgi:hypothetical protein
VSNRRRIRVAPCDIAENFPSFFDNRQRRYFFSLARASRLARSSLDSSLSEQAGALSAGATTKRFLTGEVTRSSSEILFAAVTNRRAAQAGA